MPYCPEELVLEWVVRQTEGQECYEDHVLSETQKHLNINYIMYFLNKQDMQKL